MENSWKCEIFEFNGEDAHIYVLFSAPSQVELAKLIDNLKTISSRRIRKEFSEHVAKYYWKPYFWSNSYLILSTGGATIEIIQNYIKEQDSPK